MVIDDIKSLLGFAAESTEKDNLLELIIKNSTARLKILLGGIDPPETLNYIIVEVSIIRFNRIGSEGAQSHSVDGESLSFSDDDFEQFKDEIQAYLDSQSESTRGKLRFI